jgi:hypothetical protein
VKVLITDIICICSCIYVFFTYIFMYVVRMYVLYAYVVYGMYCVNVCICMKTYVICCNMYVINM